MCICINCRHVNNCVTYRLILNQHKEIIKQTNRTFIPSNTLIKINIVSVSNLTKFDWDLVECLSFIEQPGEWLYL